MNDYNFKFSKWSEQSDVIPFHRPYPLSTEEQQSITDKIKEVLKSGQLTNGKYVRRLEDKVKEYYNVKHCIATSNATMGFFWCYKFYDWLRPLHIPNFTWPSFYYLLDRDVLIKFHDIDMKTWLMEKTFYGGTVMPVHTFGNTIEVNRNHRNKVIYDGSHSLGCKLRDIGDATVFSLAATKIITACEGGLVITNNTELAKFVKEKRNISSRMSEPNAIIGLQTLEHLSEVLAWKRKVFDYYSSEIPGIFQEIPIESNYNTIGFLNVNNLDIPSHIETKNYYEPIGDVQPNAWNVYSKIICLPSYFNCPFKKIVRDIKEVNDL